MADDVKIRTESIEGRDYDIFISNKGTFYAVDQPLGHQDDQDRTVIEAETLVKLIEKLRVRRRRAKVRVQLPATLLHDGESWHRDERRTEAEAVIITGVHATQHKPLLQRANGTKEAWSNHGNSMLARRLTEAEAAEWIAVCVARARANDAVRAFQARVMIKNVKHALTEALAVTGTTPEAVEALIGEMSDRDQTPD